MVARRIDLAARLAADPVGRSARCLRHVRLRGPFWSSVVGPARSPAEQGEPGGDGQGGPAEEQPQGLVTSTERAALFVLGERGREEGDPGACRRPGAWDGRG